jgi:MoxR-like ATPase
LGATRDTSGMMKVVSWRKLFDAARTLYGPFDEVEKAHPRVLTLMLQILDEDRLTEK